VRRAGCILINQRKQLLTVHNSASNLWGFPKGRKEYGESDDVAALRELKEETGIELPPHALNDKMRFVSCDCCFYIVMGFAGGTIKVDGKEIDDYEWKTPRELMECKVSRITRGTYKKLEQYLFSDMSNG